MTAFDAEGTGIRLADVRPDGTVTIPGLPASDYAVCVQRLHEDSAYTSTATPYGAQPTCTGDVSRGFEDRRGDRWSPAGGATTVPVVGGAASAADPITLGAAAGITGTTTSPSGAPLTGATVDVFDGSGIPVASRLTRKSGYVVPQIDPSSAGFTVCVDARQARGGSSHGGSSHGGSSHGGSSHGGYMSQCNSAVPWTPEVDAVHLSFGTISVTTSAGAASFADFMLANAGAITGAVTDDSGQALSDVSVDVRTRGDKYLATATTNDAGAYLIKRLPKNLIGYYVCFGGPRVRQPVLSGRAVGRRPGCARWRDARAGARRRQDHRRRRGPVTDDVTAARLLAC